MSKECHKVIEELAQSSHLTDVKALATAFKEQASKSKEIADMLNRPEILKLKIEHRLFVHLLVVADGTGAFF
jgi:hypothetical protein